MRRQSRVSSHASLPEHKSEAASNERSTRSRTSSEALVVLDLPKMIRTKKTGHHRPGGQGQETIKNGKGNSIIVPSVEGEVSKRGLRSTDHSIANNKDMTVAVDHLAGGDANNSGRSRRRSGRLSTTQDVKEDSEKPLALPLGVQKESRSLRRRTRSGTVVEPVGNGPSGRQATDSDSDYLQCDHQETRTEESNQVDDSKGSADALTIERQPELRDLPESTSFYEHITNSSKSGEMELHIETASIASSGVDGLAERPHKLKEKASKHDLSTTSTEGLLSRTSPRRARQVQSLSSESKDNFDTNTKDLPDEEEAQTHPRNKVRGEKTTPRKRTRSTSSSISPKKPLENQAADPVLPGSPKRRRTASVCRDLSQDFNTSKPADSETLTPSLQQTECNSELIPDPPDASNGDQIQESVSDAIDKIILKNNSVASIETSALVQRTRHRSGTSPRGTPHKHTQLDLTRSPTRRGLRSSGTVLETPASETPSEVTVTQGSEEVTPSSSPVVTHRKSSSKKKSSKKDVTHEKADSKGEEQGGLRIRVSREEVDYQAEEWFEDVDESEPFYFESDHMAIKGNKDYRMLLRTLTTLEAQRKQAVVDLDKLLECNDKALRNPIKFVHKLQHKDTLHLPISQRVVTLPEIDWARYIGAPETSELLGLVHQPRSMRPSTKTTSNAAPVSAPSSTTQTKPATMAPPAVPAAVTAGVPVNLDMDTPSTSSTPDLMQSVDAVDSKHDLKIELIRGRPADESKSATFNQLWTRHEQRRLEECLLKFPMEDVEARRWEKIAKALGNRTSQQVASRVQKYFIKLMKAGMPVPGRLPNLTTYQNNKKTGKRMHPFTKPLYQPSTFLQSVLPPVFMSDDDPYSYGFDDGFDDDDDDDDDTISDDETIPSVLRSTPEYQELLKLKQIKKRKIRVQGHAGYRCDGCEMEPIFGIRWHCTECPEEVSTDLCQNCVDCNFSSKHHSSTHRMEPVHTSYSQGFVDGDYTSFEPSVGDYNYLDPNYNPAQTT
ncbi:uncharacterized protein [Asterias amurensis]|uniref:uncharacterized protein n=1 Tax=Asterias amurensis TaxID=7602 RepID=UPI003AB56FF9